MTLEYFFARFEKRKKKVMTIASSHPSGPTEPAREGGKKKKRRQNICGKPWRKMKSGRKLCQTGSKHKSWLDNIGGVLRGERTDERERARGWAGYPWWGRGAPRGQRSESGEEWD